MSINAIPLYLKNENFSERMFNLSQRPLILSPAGSFESLTAAAEGGADEIYFGLSAHNARQNAKNFTPDEAKEALRLCRLRGIKTNITLNTLVTDREIPDACRLAYDALTMGADAFIVQDLGLASALKRSIPEITLHASTQCACHSASGAETLAELGFERIVLAREMSREEIAKTVSLGLETEIFVHGALCVCHSGMCLMSSVIGKRSGNRGLCAQPCRLPYNFGSTKAVGRDGEKYPLSLKDLTLSRHVTELAEMGITSLKIEGRMKPAEYVSGVTGIWKRLVTENRNATDEEYEYLERLFSRSGFTDGYFTSKYRTNNKNMYGVRTESDKNRTRTLEIVSDTLAEKRRVDISCRVAENERVDLSMTDGTHTVSVQSDFTAQGAKSKPMTSDDINASLSKLGDTQFVARHIAAEISGSVFLAKSQLNALRRTATERLEAEILSDIPHPAFDESVFALTQPKKKKIQPSVRIFASSAEKIEIALSRRGEYSVESVCVPLGLFCDEERITEILSEIREKSLTFGVRLPRVVFAEERSTAEALLEKAKSLGATYALAENIGHIPLVKKAGLDLYAGAGMNVYNSCCRRVLSDLGAKSVTLSPELLTAQARDIDKADGTAVVAGGRLELMVLESCIVRAGSPCKRTPDGEICDTVCDRTGAVFPIKCEHRLGVGYLCRNIILNSVPQRLIEKKDELEKTGAEIYCIYED